MVFSLSTVIIQIVYFVIAVLLIAWISKLVSASRRNTESLNIIKQAIERVEKKVDQLERKE